MSDEQADLAGPGIGTYAGVDRVLPRHYQSVLSPRDTMRSLNGDILVWNPVTRRRHELSSMGIRVTPQALRQLEMSGQLDLLGQPCHRAVIDGDIPLSIGGGIGQSRVYMLLLRKAHLGEVSVTVWPRELREISAAHNIYLLQ